MNHKEKRYQKRISKLNKKLNSLKEVKGKTDLKSSFKSFFILTGVYKFIIALFILVVVPYYILYVYEGGILMAKFVNTAFYNLVVLTLSFDISFFTITVIKMLSVLMSSKEDIILKLEKKENRKLNKYRKKYYTWYKRSLGVL